MNKRKLFIRADGGPQMGFGHITRCLALARAWTRRGGEVEFLVGGCSQAARAVQAAGFPYVRISRSHPHPSDARRVASLVPPGDGASSWLVVDGYPFDVKYQGLLRRAGWRLVVLDDTEHLPRYDADVLLNQNPGAEELPYARAGGALTLLGSRYALVGREFRPRTLRRFPKTARRVLVSFGGAERGQAVFRALRALEMSDTDVLDVDVVAGPYYPHLPALRREARRSRHTVRVVRRAKDFAGLMRKADVLVGAAGVTSKEAAAMGLPSLIGILAPNQKVNAQGIVAGGGAVSIGDWGKRSVSDVAQMFSVIANDRQLRLTMSGRGRALIDGRGAERVAQVLLRLRRGGLRQGEPVAVRAAVADALPIWRLANDPTVRRHSHVRSAIPLADHLQWYQKILTSPGQRMLILRVAGVFAGNVRYSRSGKRGAEVHFCVHPAFRGMGVAKKALASTWRLAVRELKVGRVFGTVLSPNPGSERAFGRAGYRRCAEWSRGGQGYVEFERNVR